MTELMNGRLIESPQTATLLGGPASIPDAARVCEVHASAEKIKLPHLGGYEHFVREVEIPEQRAGSVFRWTMRTRVAE